MTLAVRVALGLGLGCGITYLATPYAIRAAHRLQFYDRPAGYKGHLSPTPYLGGAALMAGFLPALLAGAGSWGKTRPLTFAAALPWLGGALHDPRGLSPLLGLAVRVRGGGAGWGGGGGWGR